ncbi:MAG: DUF2064 domain-containing protein [Armatimonadia bacterium]
MNRRLVVVADRNAHPVFCPGEPNTTLQPEVSEALFRDTLALSGSLHAGTADAPALVLAYYGERVWYQHRTSSYWLLLPQMGSTVAQLLDNVLISLALEPDDETIFLGTRTPHLSCRLLEQAFDGLARFDAIIGPCEQSGVYLLGVRGRWPTGCLAEVDWQGKRILPDLRQAMRRARLNYAALDKHDGLYDAEDLERLHLRLGEYPESTLKNTRHLLWNHAS